MKNGDSIREWAQILSRITLVTQLGFTLITPIILCIFAALWLQSHTSVGEWIWIPAILIGLISGICGAAGLIRAEIARTGSTQEDRSSENCSQEEFHGKT